MALGITSNDVLQPLLLIKVVLAVLAVLLFVYYRYYWESKRHLSIPFFYAKWRAVKHAFILGIRGARLCRRLPDRAFRDAAGLSAGATQAVSSAFEICSLLVMLYMSLTLTLEDVPHFQHIAEEAVRTAKGRGTKTGKAKPKEAGQREEEEKVICF